MSKKRKSRPAKGGRPGSAGTARPAVVSLSDYRAESAIAAVTPAFVDWFSRAFGDADDAKTCLSMVTTVVARYYDVAKQQQPATAFEVDPLARTLLTLEDDGPEEAQAYAEAFHLYIDFLRETGTWTGGDDELERVHDVIHADSDDDESGIPVIRIPDLAEDEEFAALGALPLISRARALLDWLGGGKPVTSTGVLRLKDIEPAAAAVGVAARGSTPKQSTEATLPGLDDLEDLREAGPALGEEPMVVRTMHDVPALRWFWYALISTGLIEIGATKASPHPRVADFLRGDDSEALAEYRAFVREVLRACIADVAESPILGTALSTILVTELAAACTDTPPITEQLRQAGSTEPDEARLLPRLLVTGSLRYLEALAELGLLEMKTLITVPPAVVRGVGEAFGYDFDLEVEYPEGEPDVSFGQSSSNVYQLKVTLRDSKPPIWRRVLVPADIRLDAVHDVIQRLFGWDGSHLHAFQAGGRMGPVYGPKDPDMPAIEESIDEATVPLSAVVGSAGEKIMYTYDFGDDWDHVVTLEKILDPQPDAELPRCTGGRRAAPLDDTGGVWGWLDMLEAANNPQHPEHTDIREWFGLDAGETFDPAHFDQDEINKALRALAPSR